MKNRIDFTQVTGVTDNSHDVKNGFIFVAIKGVSQDGHKYIAQAIASGAKIIIHQDEVTLQAGITYLKVEDSRIALSEIASTIYSQQPKYIMGVTGTSGKSSIVHFIREILQLLDKKVVSIGTMGVLGDLTINSSLTTPSTIQTHQILEQVAEKNIDYVAIECSSHGIDQHRLDSVNFLSCAFTNLSQDHLDYHQNMDEYFQAKQKLFALSSSQYAVLNGDIKEFEQLYNNCIKLHQKIICYGKSKAEFADHNIIIASIKILDLTQQVSWDIDGKIYQSKLNLVGEFQIYNLACAIGLLMSCGIEVSKIMPLLTRLKTVTGRMELVAHYKEAGVFIDYAHKPEALIHALKTLKAITPNNLWLVFGCGGNRDQGKRSIMGKVASDYADKIIITDDNPRSEEPAKIRQEIIAGCNKKIDEIGQREEAIAFALSNLQPGDNLIIAGKGHETYQLIGKETIEFSDHAKVLELIAKK
jgi:UDP-N-acetylmuramoyl-L-alanyl-D-glutamate--2,6-diaminopimelate ligase